MKEGIISFDKKNIEYSFELDGKIYCAMTDDEASNDEGIYFGLITKVDDNNSVITSVSEQDMEKVIAEYKKHCDFFDSEDELDINEEEENYYD